MAIKRTYMMKIQLITAFIGIALMASCLAPSEKISGNYHGQYTNNALILMDAHATITKVDQNTINLTLSHSSISPVTIEGINVTEGDNNSFALVKTDFINVLSGAVEGNELSISYSYLGGVITFVGTK
jgi:hypothetical protein